jgi:hypothetical protein
LDEVERFRLQSKSTISQRKFVAPNLRRSYSSWLFALKESFEHNAGGAKGRCAALHYFFIQLGQAPAN